MQLENTICKSCGAPLDLNKAVNGVVTCIYCGNPYTLPKQGASPEVLSFLRMGEHDLDTCKFEEAFSAYKKASELDGSEPEAYFGMALSEFKVQYLRDVSGEKPKLQPICHEITDKKFTDNANYMRACLKATDKQRAEYERKAQEIDYILGEFYKLKQSGLDYDCFICVKVTGDSGKTEDSKDADYIYRMLQQKGYKPFYSEYEIRNKQGADYEAHILYALHSSECMLVVCRDESYLQTPWVKNEYTRFLKLVNDDEKESDSITVVFNGKPIERLPGKRGKLQGINFALRESDGLIVDFVENHTPEARAKKSLAEKAEKEKEAAILKEIEKQKEAQREFEERQREAQRALEERIKNIKATSSSAKGNDSASVNSLLLRANQFLSGGEFDNAIGYYNKVLDIDPESAEAWLGLLLSTSKIKTYQEFLNGKSSQQIQQIFANKHYKMAKQYANGSTKTVNDFEAYAKQKYEQTLKAEAEQRERAIQEEEKKRKNAVREQSRAAWNAFVHEIELKDEGSKLRLNGAKVEIIKGNASLAKAYSLADKEQKEEYDEYMRRIRERVAELKEEETKNLETLKADREQKEKAYNEKRKKYGDVTYWLDIDEIGLKFLWIAGISAIVLFVLGFGSCIFAPNETFYKLFDLLGLGEKIMSGETGPVFPMALTVIIGAIVGGCVIGAIPTLLVFLPINLIVHIHNGKYFKFHPFQQEFEIAKNKVETSIKLIAAYEQYLKDGNDFKVEINREKFMADIFTADNQAGGDALSQNTEITPEGCCELYILSAGAHSVEVIKVVRQLTGYDLVRAKEAVEMGRAILNGISYKDAIKAKEDLEKAGAQVGLKKI
ncbi:MAG: ribosomal protein L7/L12 [Clostridiales bacterium]|nr:ribosomal protein L7/L12 [Clostridiales bacterium]